MTRNFIIVSGGPGLYVSCDPDHDKAWSNYVDNILLLARNNKLPVQNDEEVWWFVYGPAYERRWKDDVSNNRSSVKQIKRSGSTDYKHHLQKRANQYGWNLRWLTSGNDFWRRMKTFRDPISRVWYFGHARTQLWLSLEHDIQRRLYVLWITKCSAIAPPNNERIFISQINTHSSLASKFQAGGSSYDASRSSRFYGCNTAAFAKRWATVFNVYSEGAQGKVDFATAHPNGGRLNALLTGCTWKKYAPGGSLMP